LAKVLFALGLSLTDVSIDNIKKTGNPQLKTSSLYFIRDQIGELKEDIRLAGLHDQLISYDQISMKRMDWIREISQELIDLRKSELNNNELNSNLHSESSGYIPKIVRMCRADIVGIYQGSSGINLKKAYEKARGGILVLDEAYALVNADNDDNGDNFSV